VQESVSFSEEKEMRCLPPPPQQPPPEGFEMLMPGVWRKVTLLTATKHCKCDVDMAMWQ